MITLFQFPPYWGLLNPSIFCMKLEVLLRMTNIPYQVKTIRNPRTAPKGKLPFINDEGTLIADSSFIVDHLIKKYSITLDDHLTPQQQAISLALQRLIEEHLYWIVLYSRWIDDQNWETTKDFFFGKKRSFFINLLTTVIQKRMRKDLNAQGIGRHSKEQIYTLGFKDLKAIEHLIEGPFVFGENPSSVDAIVYAVMSNIMFAPINSPLKEYANGQSIFLRHCEAMKAIVLKVNQ